MSELLPEWPQHLALQLMVLSQSLPEVGSMQADMCSYMCTQFCAHLVR